MSESDDEDVQVVAIGGNFTQAVLFLILLVPSYTRNILQIYTKTLLRYSNDKPLYFLAIEETNQDSYSISDKFNYFLAESKYLVYENITNIEIRFLIGFGIAMSIFANYFIYKE